MRLAHQFAMESDLIRADMVEATEFPHLVQRHRVMGVPRTVVNETHYIDGALPEDAFLAQILESLEPVSRRG